jgi:5'-3' exoribonuclease 1
VLDHRAPGSLEHQRKSRLTMPNIFPAADRKFISDLADDLHLSLTWDEYDEQDQNLITWRFPGELDQPVPEGEENGQPTVEEDSDEVWEDEEDEESKAAVDRVLAKYEKAKVANDDKEGDFDARYEQSIRDKMDEWKRGYYKVDFE